MYLDKTKKRTFVTESASEVSTDTVEDRLYEIQEHIYWIVKYSGSYNFDKTIEIKLFSKCISDEPVGSLTVSKFSGEPTQFFVQLGSGDFDSYDGSEVIEFINSNGLVIPEDWGKYDL